MLDRALDLSRILLIILFVPAMLVAAASIAFDVNNQSRVAGVQVLSVTIPLVLAVVGAGFVHMALRALSERRDDAP